VSRFSDRLDSIAETIRRGFIAKDAARERAIPLCRESIRYSSTAIRAIHRREFDNSREKIDKARELINEAEESLAAWSELRNVSWNAQKEFAEASITLALVADKTLPTPDELGTDYAAYLNGLGEAVGELRRYLLDSLRGGDLSQGEGLLQTMDDAYNVLVSMDFPDAITGGLRHTTDMVRGVLEKTRSDLTLTIQQKRLEDKLAKFKNNL
jgi:translin